MLSCFPTISRSLTVNTFIPFSGRSTSSYVTPRRTVGEFLLLSEASAKVTHLFNLRLPSPTGFSGATPQLKSESSPVRGLLPRKRGIVGNLLRCVNTHRSLLLPYSFALRASKATHVLCASNTTPTDQKHNHGSAFFEAGLPRRQPQKISATKGSANSAASNNISAPDYQVP